jgi:4-hydroxy-2-oxoheptanedioate aldolase
MAEIPRLNGVIRALEQGKPATSIFAPIDNESAWQISQSKYDSVIFEGEHNPWSSRGLRDALQYKG